MCLRLQRRACSIHRQVHLTMQAPRCGVINLMITKVTFGHLDASYTNPSLWNPHFVQMTCKDFIRKFWEECIQRYRLYSQLTWPIWSNHLCRLHHKCVLVVRESWNYRTLERELRSSSLRMNSTIVNLPYLIPFVCQKICFIWQIACRSRVMKVLSSIEKN